MYIRGSEGFSLFYKSFIVLSEDVIMATCSGAKCFMAIIEEFGSKSNIF